MTDPQRLLGGRQVAFPSLPEGDAVATFPTYPEAQAAVERLVRTEGFPVQSVAVVGDGMRSVERVTGRLSWGRAAAAGAVSGFWFGLLLGVVTELFSPARNGIGYVIGAVLIGAAFGMLFGLVSYAVTRRRRDFSSVMQVVATSYSIVVPTELSGRARRAIGGGGDDGTPGAPPAGPQDGGPGTLA